MGVAVTFDYDDWISRFPELSSVSETLAGEYFDEAGLFLRNDGGGVIQTTSIQRRLLYLLTAHLAYLYSISDTSNGGLVGRISSASEGSVSVSTEMPTTASNAWYLQSKYGAEYWYAVKAFRLGPIYRRPVRPRLPF